MWSCEEAIRPAFSICLAAFNGSRYIGEQLQSIAAEMHVDDELIVVDDHSEDETLLVAERSLEGCGLSRVSVVRLDSNVGHRRAFAHAISLAKNPIVTLSDQDDLWAPKRLDVLARTLEGSSADLVFGSLDVFGSTSQPAMMNVERFQRGYGGLAEFMFLRRRNRVYAYGSACAFRRTAIDLSLPIATEAHEYWLVAQALARGGVHYTAEVVTRRRLHDKNLTRRRPLLARMAGGLRTYRQMTAVMHLARKTPCENT